MTLRIGSQKILLSAMLAMVLVFVAACSGAKRDHVAMLGADAGLACSAIPEKDVASARVALTCAQAVLTSTAIDIPAIGACADKAGVPVKYKRIVAAAISRVRAHLGSETGPLVPLDSDAGRALLDFFEVCGAVLA